MSVNLIAPTENCDIAHCGPHQITARPVGPLVHQTELISRSELKFAISEETAARVRESALLSMKRDAHCNPENGEYEVHTMYFDSSDVAIYRKSLNREFDHFKLRLRFYDDDPASVVFMEIKKSAPGHGSKKRIAVERRIANILFSPHAPSMIVNAAEDCEFWALINRFKARPIIHIGYVREAFIGRDNPHTRLTLDRMIRCQPAPSRLTSSMENPIHIWQGKVILEIKFAGEMPDYLRDLIDVFRLQSVKASKYLQSVTSGLRM